MLGLEKNLNFQYNIEQLTLLQDVYLSMLDNEVYSEYWMTENNYEAAGVTGFVGWLSEEDRTKLL